MPAPTPQRHYIILCFIIFLNGWFSSSYGPLIPHLSEATGQDQTSYSYLFLVRSIASLLGGLLVKNLIRMTQAQTLMISYLSILVLSQCAAAISIYTSSLIVTLFFASVAIIGTNVLVFSSIIQIFAKDRPDQWIQINSFMFGAGSVCGPFFVAILKLDTFIVLGAAHLLPIFALLLYPLPNLSGKQSQNENLQAPKLSLKSILFISLVIFFNSTLDIGTGSWISTYAVKSGVSDVDGSSTYNLIFSLSGCIGKFLWVCIPGTIEQRLRLGLAGVVLSSMVNIVFQWLQMFEPVCIFSSLSFGLLVAGVFGFCISLPVKNGFAPQPENNAIFIFANALGEGLVTLIGWSMNIFSFQAMMFELCLFAILAFSMYTQVPGSMEEDANEYKIAFLEDQSRETSLQ